MKKLFKILNKWFDQIICNHDYRLSSGKKPLKCKYCNKNKSTLTEVIT